MCRIIDLSRLANLGLRLLALCLVLATLNGCAVMKSVKGDSALFSGPLAQDIEKNEFSVARGDDVIGRLATVRLEPGDTLPDIARHFGLGLTAISAANPGVDVWVPEPGARVVLPLNFILPDAPRKGIVINLATMRLFHFKGDGNSLAVTTYPVGIGTKERPTPTGQMYVQRKATRPTWYVPASIAEDHRKKGDPLPAKVPPGPLNPLGDRALYLSKAGYLIHGTNKPASIGLKASNGCLRLYPENVQMLYDDTPVKTPVVIVNQPYLLGQQDGVLYLEAHKPQEDSGVAELEKVYAKLRDLEKKAATTLDWKKVKEVQLAAQGIPVPIFAMRQGAATEAEPPIAVAHPAKLYGRPELPELKPDAWYVLAATVRDETDALRLAAIINHQGPPIPARVLAKNDSHRVIAGPFPDISAARDAVKRLKIDLEIDGILIEPDQQG
ncbi:L,D-transpeptidase family protein [Geobacter pelophilus]|uniref:L,D-transpeptidase family protein n=1 Tax=Geoanaerobacter pelophilus TaxID=60036 RepID=A0AAW4KZP7_9BACT|nr:L,D-transpeptidase family protein [Geoanaerobacter pelophilus]MBT0664141.1 L,D-transpeptidase family protein [Geoanaerobacter pelophilus]